MLNYNEKYLKIIDFNLSVFYSPSLKNLKQGTISSFSPELLLNFNKFDFSIDIWAAGIMLLRCIMNDPFLLSNIKLINQIVELTKVNI